MKKFLIFLIIVLLLGGVAFFIYKNPQYNPFLGNQNVTVKALTEEEAKNEVLEATKKYYYDQTFAYDNYCSITVVDEEDKVFISNVESAYRLKKYDKFSELKAYMESFMTTNFINKFSTKFIEKNNKLYCIVPALSYPLINEDSLQVATVSVSNDTIEANCKYTKGDGELYKKETVNIKVTLKNLENKWKIDSIENIKA